MIANVMKRTPVLLAILLLVGSCTTNVELQTYGTAKVDVPPSNPEPGPSECELRLRELKTQEEKAGIWGKSTTRLNLEGQASEQRQVIVNALTELNRLGRQLSKAKRRFDDSLRMNAVWQGDDFRNPQNYRALALGKQLEAVSKFRSAQILTWLILRSAAYDLARPDFAAPQQFAAGDVLQISQCGLARCKSEACDPSTESCFTESSATCVKDSDCLDGEACALVTDESSGLASSDGSCSMQAVFAARTVDELRSLIRSAFQEEVVTYRTVACSGNCEKTVSLRRLFADPDEDGTDSGNLNPPALGDVLLARDSPTVEFGIDLTRSLRICTRSPEEPYEKRCLRNGFATLREDDSGPGNNLADNLWNARALNVGGVIRYKPNRDPGITRCRDGATGAPAGAFVCGADADCTSCALRDEDGNPLLDDLGDPVTISDTQCVCEQVFRGNPVAELAQVGPGVVRTSFAERSEDCFADASCPADSQLRFRMRSGDLPLSGDRTDFDFFRVLDLTLFPDTGTARQQFNANIRGVPVASPGWELSIRTDGLVSGTYRDELLASIEDVELIFQYQGFNLER